MSFKNGVLEGSGLDFGDPGLDFEGLGARFWRPQTSSLKPPGSIVGPPAFLWLSFPHSTTQLDQCGTDLLPGVPSFSARAFLKGLANVWEAAVSPLGGLQSAAHRRCAKRARSPAPSLSDTLDPSQLANLKGQAHYAGLGS